jgi:glycosyltransferase involved in cell wall biosynthesis
LDDFRMLPDPSLFRSRLGLDGRPVIGYLGRIHPGKGLEYLVPALATLQNHDAVLVAAGPDSHGYQRAIESLAETHGVRERVFFPGMLRGKAKVEMLCSTDLFVMASHHENFGIAVAEAMAAGCAVIVSDHVGIKSDIEKAACGAVVPLDVSRIAVEIDAWLGDESRCRTAGQRGRTFALTEYDWDQIAARWQAHYESLMSHN